MKENNRDLQSSVESKFTSLYVNAEPNQEINDKLQSIVESQISSLQDKVRSDFKAENEKLIKRFEAEHERLNKELSEKLYSETKKFAHLVSQVQKGAESELVDVKRQIRIVNTELGDKLERTYSQTAVIGELSKIDPR
jgi:hypothetical protein